MSDRKRNDFEEMMIEEIRVAMVQTQTVERDYTRAELIFDYLDEAGHFRGGRGPTVSHNLDENFISRMHGANTREITDGSSRTDLVGEENNDDTDTREGRIILIGIHPIAQGLGLARKLIEHAAHSQWFKNIRAGTYANNDGARKLYGSLGMKPVKYQKVFHK